MIAEIAQLVEHDLAKVGVAGSSPVFRSKAARMVESVDTQDLKSCDHCGCAGSSPAPGTEGLEKSGLSAFLGANWGQINYFLLLRH